MYRVDVLYALGDVIMLIMFLLLLLHYFCIFRCNFGTEINQKKMAGLRRRHCRRHSPVGWPGRRQIGISVPTALPSA